MMLDKLKKFFLDTFFPCFCLGCSKEGALLCPDCFGLIPISEYHFCPFCPRPQRLITKGKCSTHQDRKLNGLFSAADYQNRLVKKLLHQFKYAPYLKNLAKSLSFLIIAHFLLSENKILFHNKEKSLFLPVPLLKKKEKERGYNQSLLLACELSNFYGIPIVKNALCKIKKTQPQVGLTKEKRKENIQGAFAVKNPLPIQNKIIFLVDDVFTTGATLEECAKVLKAAGAKQVWGITVAREMFAD